MKKKKQQDYDKLINEVVRIVVEAQANVVKRCLMEGHCYGYELIDKEPRGNCIYCGEARQQPNWFDETKPATSIQNWVNKTLKKKDK